MDKILSINTIKNVFSALGAKTSDDNYGVALLDKTSGEPKGLMGMSDLASVLGYVRIHQVTTYALSANQTQTHELPESGLYICALGSSSMYNLVLVGKGQQGLKPLIADGTWSGNRIIIEPNDNNTFKTTCDGYDRDLSFFRLFV